jgi:hypothetical protein
MRCPCLKTQERRAGKAGWNLSLYPPSHKGTGLLAGPIPIYFQSSDEMKKFLEWSPPHGFTGVVPFIRDFLPAMPGVRRGRRAPQPVLQMLSIFRMRSMGQLVPVPESPFIPGQALGFLGTGIPPGRKLQHYTILRFGTPRGYNYDQDAYVHFVLPEAYQQL